MLGFEPCAKGGPPAPTAGYRADVSIRVSLRDATEPTNAQLVESYDRKKRRREMQIDGEPLVVVDRPDLFVAWILHPTAKAFDEHRITSLELEIHSIPDPFGPRTDAAFEDLGVETVEGRRARKFAVSGVNLSGTAWTTEDHIPLKFIGTLRSENVAVEVTYSNIERGIQPAHLFGVPSNYAGYAERKQKRAGSSPPLSTAEVEAVKRRLEEQQRPRTPF